MAASAARTDAPVAAPSSVITAIRPATFSGSPWRSRSSIARASAVAASYAASISAVVSTEAIRRLVKRSPIGATAPIASSG